MRPRSTSLIPSLALLLAACSAGTSPSVPVTASATPVPSQASPSAASPERSVLATRVEVALNDALRIEPASMTVPAGVPVTFVVKNVRKIDHEFFLGDEQAQAEHEREMQEMGGMMHDEPMGIVVPAGARKELTVTFSTPGTILAGCHVAGHYLAGMKATIEIR